MSHLFLCPFVERMRGSRLAREEYDFLENLEKEVLRPTLKWIIIGALLVFFITVVSPDAIGTVMILLTLYLLYGLVLYVRGVDQQIGALAAELGRDRILFRTEMIKRKRGELVISVLILLLVLFCLVVLMVKLYWSESFHLYWEMLDSGMKSDHFALLFSVIISLTVIFIAVHKVAEISDLVLTDRGIYISENFYPWCVLTHCEVEYFSRRPLNLLLETADGSKIRIDLYRFRVDNGQAEKIAAILKENAHPL